MSDHAEPILIVMPAGPVAQAISADLIQAGHAVEHLTTGALALVRLCRVQPGQVAVGILVVAHDLPGLAGGALIKAARASRGAALPAVMVGGSVAGLAAAVAIPADGTGAVAAVAVACAPPSAAPVHLPVAVPEAVDLGPPEAPGILLVEDNHTNQRVASQLLQRAGYRVRIAEDGQQALVALSRGGIGCVLMDCAMPVMDGYAATQAWRRQEAAGSHVPVIALTANALVGDRERCLAAGMDDYLTKPVDADQLIRTVAAWLGHGPAAAPVAAAPALTDEVPLVDPEVGIKLRSYGADLWRDAVATFVLELPDKAVAIDLALAASAIAEAGRLAHAIKGSSGTLGAKALARHLADVEHACRRSDLAAAKHSWQQARSVLDATVMALRAD